MVSSPITSWQIDVETMETVRGLIFLGSKIAADSDCSHDIKRRLLLERKSMTNLDSILKNRDISLPTNVCLVKAVAFPVVMYGYESWILKAECWKIDAFELWCWRRLKTLLGCKIKPVNCKENQSWIFIGRTDAEAEAAILRQPDAKNWLIGKDPDSGKDWRQKEKGTTEDDMAWWHHGFDGHEFAQVPGDGEGQGSLVCCSPWGHKESDMTGQLNNNKCTFSPKVSLRSQMHLGLSYLAFLGPKKSFVK